ncbi:MAG: glycosyltransferase [Nitrospirae bacterium]|nr:glycosyltransferase [Nitrospirota bacterium]
MRILYLTDSAPDYLADLLYVGLCRTLGSGQVVDYPYKALYHDPLHRVHYAPQIPGRRYQEEEVAALLREKQFDLAILSSPRRGATTAWESLSHCVAMPPLVLLDGEDDATIRQELFHRYQCALYFKREYRLNRDGGLCGLVRRFSRSREDVALAQRTYPLPLAVALETLPTIPIVPRDVDVSYVARISHPKRRRAVEMLRQAHGVGFQGGVYAEAEDRQSKFLSGFSRVVMKLTGDPVVTVAQRGTKLSQAEYYALLSRSKMALSIRGGGFDTLRYWEVVASGALLLSEQPDIEVPNNFVHGKQALFFRPDLSDLVDLVRTYASDARACAAMASEGHKHLLQYHTCERRAEQLLAVCGKTL